MGLFKQLKDMKNVVGAAPAMIAEARALQQQAYQTQAAAGHYAAPAAGQYGHPAMAGVGVPQPADIPPGDLRLAPIEGVSLELYAQVSKAAATHRLDEAGMARYAATLGADPVTWPAAIDGWNARMRGDMQLATQFGRLYQNAQV
ncbi:hypothetical protein [Micromonospora echinofusca]|uniref:Excreted virulence factor EspC, type VII ESX diderm n=1 Tax=Micromonospora echinofusca TaxID=47858 RepID=A0ABS3VUH4_MICEH|nr:hypothetical protein [Micromonospora echinofusca]MBO4208121.1 hypothetical protein [Micromonospora echinofusca]